MFITPRPPQHNLPPLASARAAAPSEPAGEQLSGPAAFRARVARAIAYANTAWIEAQRAGEGDPETLRQALRRFTEACDAIKAIRKEVNGFTALNWRLQGFDVDAYMREQGVERLYALQAKVPPAESLDRTRQVERGRLVETLKANPGDEAAAMQLLALGQGDAELAALAGLLPRDKGNVATIHVLVQLMAQVQHPATLTGLATLVRQNADPTVFREYANRLANLDGLDDRARRELRQMAVEAWNLDSTDLAYRLSADRTTRTSEALGLLTELLDTKKPVYRTFATQEYVAMRAAGLTRDDGELTLVAEALPKGRGHVTTLRVMIQLLARVKDPATLNRLAPIVEQNADPTLLKEFLLRYEALNGDTRAAAIGRAAMAARFDDIDELDRAMKRAAELSTTSASARELLKLLPVHHYYHTEEALGLRALELAGNDRDLVALALASSPDRGNIASIHVLVPLIAKLQSAGSLDQLAAVVQKNGDPTVFATYLRARASRGPLAAGHLARLTEVARAGNIAGGVDLVATMTAAGASTSADATSILRGLTPYQSRDAREVVAMRALELAGDDPARLALAKALPRDRGDLTTIHVLVQLFARMDDLANLDALTELVNANGDPTVYSEFNARRAVLARPRLPEEPAPTFTDAHQFRNYAIKLLGYRAVHLAEFAQAGDEASRARLAADNRALAELVDGVTPELAASWKREGFDVVEFLSREGLSLRS